MFWNPTDAASIPFLVLGICSIIYGLSEFVNVYKMKNMLHNHSKNTDSAKANPEMVDAEEVK